MAHELGVQSFTYRQFTVQELCEELAETDVTAIEPCNVHVAPDAGTDEVSRVKSLFEEAGLDVCGYGVHDLSHGPEADIPEVVEFVDDLGGEYLSVDFDPEDRQRVERALDAAEDHDVVLAVHNHGPDAHYSTVEDVLDVLDEFRHDRLGACVDTGHFFRSGQSPGDVLPELGRSVFAVHLKDFVDEETEAVPGEGNLDVGEFLDLLDEYTDFDGPLVVEYEADADDPTPAVQRTLDRLRDRRA